MFLMKKIIQLFVFPIFFDLPINFVIDYPINCLVFQFCKCLTVIKLMKNLFKYCNLLLTNFAIVFNVIGKKI